MTLSHQRRRSAPLAVVITLGIAMTGCAASEPEEPAGPEQSADAASDAFRQDLQDLLPESVQESGVVRFGALWATPPVIGTDPNDATVAIGFAPDLAAAIGDVLGVETEWRNLDWPGQLPALESGTVDALFGQLSDNEEREPTVADFVQYSAAANTISVLVPLRNPNSIGETAESLCGLRVSFGAGGEFDSMVQGFNDDVCADDPIEGVGYPDAAGAIVAMQAGGVDAWLGNSTSQNKDVIASLPDTFEIADLPYELVEPYASAVPGIGFSKDQPELTEAFVQAFLVVFDNGTYDELMDEWFEPADQTPVSRDDIRINPFTDLAAGELG